MLILQAMAEHPDENTKYLKEYCIKGNYILYALQNILGFNETNPYPWALSFQIKVRIPES